MSAETRDTLLHGQLQEGLRDEIMRAPAVSGAPTYKELCLTSKNEEKRLIDLRKRRGYHQPPKTTPRTRTLEKPAESKGKKSQGDSPGAASQDSRKCFVCHRPGHLARDCSKRTESGGRKNSSPAQSRTLQLRTVTLGLTSPVRRVRGTSTLSVSLTMGVLLDVPEWIYRVSLPWEWLTAGQISQ